MVEIIQENRRPSFAQRLNLGIERGLQGVSDLYNQKAADKAFHQFTGQNISGLPADAKQEIIKQYAKMQSQQQLLRDFSGESSQGIAQGSLKSEFQPLNPQKEAVLALTNPSAFNAYQTLKQSYAAEKEKAQNKENLQETLGEMVNTLLEGNLGYTAGRFSQKGRRDVQYFDTLGTQLESIGKEMVSKGVLSAPRFAYLLGNLPSSHKTDAANAGALEAWGKELKLEIPGIDNLKSLYEGKNAIKKVKKGTPLTLESMEKIYKKTGGDKEKAKSVAKKMGYDVE